MQRMTKQRAAIAELLESTHDFKSAQQLHDLLRERGETAGLATVYRTLQNLADAHELDVIRTEDGEMLYRMCERTEHHHHLVCRSCGKTIEIDGPTVEEWAAMVGGNFGFSDIEHTIELFGTCQECAS
ncbi:Fur family transcriptional regulator [Timonella senegalensis]|uniref:Fur family transcriptional regulator n=1 Tax=Timonella senegalensis TaxID=1465825 RepID=UPI0002F70450|nr:Fur family transcriptional regulator [Timonella senegalensis]